MPEPLAKPLSDLLPDRFDDVEALDEFMTRPGPALIADLAEVDGDIIVLGVGGKMGPTLARLAKRAAPDKRVIGVARFSESGLADSLQSWGVETVPCDLLDRDAVVALPKPANVVFMAGRKFGTSDRLDLTWAMNAHVPAIVAEAFRDSRIVAFSTGNVYPFVEVAGGGASEATPVGPIGEYAQSCLGRERMFEYFSGASACSNISRGFTARRAASSGSITPSTCDTACCGISRPRSATGCRSTSPRATSM